MYYILKELNRFTELYPDCQMKHGLDGDTNSDADFGTGFAIDDDVYLYIVQRAAIFFQTIMNVGVNAAFPAFGYRGKSLFRETVNNRICGECDGNPSSDVCPEPIRDLGCEVDL